MKKEEKIIDFDESGYADAVGELKQFARHLSERPHEGSDPLSLRDLERNGIINECFCSSCVKLGLTPGPDILKAVLHVPEQRLEGIVTGFVLAELDKQNIHEAVQPSIMLNYKPSIKEFMSVVVRLNQFYSFAGRPSSTGSKRIQQIENYLTFIDGKATVTDETLESLKGIFETRLDTPDRQEIYDLLSVAGGAITRLNAKLLTMDRYFTPMTYDDSYLSSDGTVISPKNDIIKFF